MIQHTACMKCCISSPQENKTAKAAILQRKVGLILSPAKVQMANSEMEMVSIYGRDNLLKQVLMLLKQD